MSETTEPVKRGRGRPKGSRLKPRTEGQPPIGRPKGSTLKPRTESQPPIGRPRGSKNKRESPAQRRYKVGIKFMSPEELAQRRQRLNHEYQERKRNKLASLQLENEQLRNRLKLIKENLGEI